MVTGLREPTSLAVGPDGAVFTSIAVVRRKGQVIRDEPPARLRLHGGPPKRDARRRNAERADAANFTGLPGRSVRVLRALGVQIVSAISPPPLRRPRHVGLTLPRYDVPLFSVVPWIRGLIFTALIPDVSY